jgi:neutral ceramidase
VVTDASYNRIAHVFKRPDDGSFGKYTFQVLGSRLKPGCAEKAIVEGPTGMIDRLR